MNSLNIPQHIIQSIGWTLIHSLWQGLLIFALLKIATRLFPRSDVRYGLGVGALLLMIISSVATFLVLNEAPVSQGSFQFVLAAGQAQEKSFSLIATVLNWIDANIIWLIRFWVLGFVVGLVRIAAGLFYINRLRKTSHPVADEWMHMVNDLSQGLKIKRVVAIAEAGITSPMVVGFMKPIILFPFGLLAGLTPEQVETILVHELSHVRRQDYIINLFQAIIETIFFFNPFVILVSSLIREERENCCDDMVIAKGISPISYVKTLAQLEASRSSSTLALGISGNKNQLLNRIKRIMENSAKNDWGKGRLLPVALVFLGLICASWLSIGAETEKKGEVLIDKVSETSITVADTSREDGLKVLKSNKHKRYGGVPAPPDFEFIPGPPTEPADMDMNIDIDIPDVMMMPEIEGLDGLAVQEAMEALEALEQMPMGPMDFHFDLDRFSSFDSIPGFEYRELNEEEMEQFEKEFTKKFKEQFKDFYQKNEKEFNKMMEEVKKEHREAAEVVDLEQLRRFGYSADNWKVLNDKLWQIQNAVPNPDFFIPDSRNTNGVIPMDEHVARLEQKMKELQLDEHARAEDIQFRRMDEQMREQADFAREMARKMERYNAELVDMLREDGYLGKSEDTDGLNITDKNGKLSVNGKEIKEKDQVKYRALRDKHFPENVRTERYRRSE